MSGEAALAADLITACKSLQGGCASSRLFHGREETPRGHEMSRPLCSTLQFSPLSPAMAHTPLFPMWDGVLDTIGADDHISITKGLNSLK